MWLSTIESLYRSEFLGNSGWNWVLGAAVAFVTYSLLVILKRLLVKRLFEDPSSKRSEVRLFIVGLIQHTKVIFFLAFSVLVAVHFLRIEPSMMSVIRSALFLVLLIQVWFWADEVLQFVILRISGGSIDTAEKTMQGSAMPALLFVGRLLIFATLILLGLDNFGVNVTALLTGLGIGGIAIALAVQNILGDLFASLSILLDKPFVVGDFVVIGDMRGTVERIGLKTTRIRSIDGEQVVISNADLLSSRIQNYKRMTDRRVVFRIGVTYQTPIAKLEKLSPKIRELFKSIPGTRFDRASLFSFGASSLDFEIVYWVLSSEFEDYAEAQEKINLALMKLMEQEKIDFAYPTQTVFLAKEALNA